MDRAQQITITPEGLQVPWYLTNGNHDCADAGQRGRQPAFEDVAIGCLKVLASTQDPGPGAVDPGLLLEPPSGFMLVPPDPERQMVDKAQLHGDIGSPPLLVATGREGERERHECAEEERPAHGHRGAG